MGRREEKEQDVQRLDAALKKICADTDGSVVITDLSESTIFDKLCAYGCVKRSDTPSRQGTGYKLTDEGRNFYRNGGFLKEFMNEQLIEASANAAIATANLARFQRRATICTIAVASLTLIALVVQIVISVCRR
jgi:hypothetical protein